MATRLGKESVAEGELNECPVSVVAVSKGMAGSQRLRVERQVPRYSMTIEWSPLDEAFIVTIPELSKCRTHGDTYEEAVKNGREVIEPVVSGLLEDGTELPVPVHHQNGEMIDLHEHRDSKAVRRAG